MSTISPAETDPEAPRSPTRRGPRPPRWLAAAAGIVAAAVATTMATFGAAMLGVVGPLDAVGSAFIDRTPLWLKNLAVDLFGTSDKLALRIGTLIVIAAFAAAVGVLAMDRPWIGTAGIAVFGGVGVLAALERPDQPPSALLPPLVAVAAGIITLRLLLASLGRLWQESLVPGRSMSPAAKERRRFIGLTGAAVGAAVLAGTTAPLLERRRVRAIGDSGSDTLPPVDESLGTNDFGELTVAGITPFITTNQDFYRIDTALRFPSVNVDDWTLRIQGMVDREISLRYDELLDEPMVERMITLCCVSNEVGGDLIGNAVWQGVLLRPLLERAGVHPDAEQVFSESVDGFTCGFPVEAALDGRDCLIAVGMNGEPLPVAHGFPARLVVPGLYGYVSATKWLQRVELTTWTADQGYWIPRGWSREGPVKTQSRIDVPRRGQELSAGRVAVAGVAWAQHRGVTKVEVRVDRGDWEEARLSDGAGVDVWRQWVYEWEATPGDHILQVRATDGTGEPQTEVVTSVAPNGATGYHTRRATVTA